MTHGLPKVLVEPRWPVGVPITMVAVHDGRLTAFSRRHLLHEIAHIQCVMVRHVTTKNGTWCFGGSETCILNRKFPTVQNFIYSGMSPGCIWVLWWLRNPYFESQMPNGSKSHTVKDVPPVVSRCFGGSETRTLNRKFPILQSLIRSRMSPSGILVLWWLRNPYFESEMPNGSKSHKVRDDPQWFLGALVA